MSRRSVTEVGSELLTRAEVARELAISEGQLAKLIKAGEFGSLKRGQRLTAADVIAWRTVHKSVELGHADYLRALHFSVEEFYLGGTKSDFGSNTRRGAGKFIDDYTRGKIGELSFATFMRDSHGLEMELDFDHHADVPAQDIDKVWRVGKRTKNPPSIRVSIKTTKSANTYLLVPEDEFTNPDRRSEAYVLARVDLPEDHLVRELFRAGGLQKLDLEVTAKLGELTAGNLRVTAEIAGFAWRTDFPDEPVQRVDDLELAKPNRVLRTGQLRNTVAAWREFAGRLLPASLGD